ncbi:MAG TPA: MFS transporter [Lachnospiraceae bacterium]|nr:MFS transporter [Lachnospiraceae bacterium]
MINEEETILKIFKNLTEQENAWVLYDVGNSAFTMLACSLIPIWFKSIAVGGEAGQLSGDRATAMWALAIAIATVLVALLGPFFGSVADHKDTRRLLFTTAVSAGCLFCIFTGMASSWFIFLLLFILTKVFYQASLTFYDSMLVDVTTEERSDEVSSYGYAWGYLGSCIPFIVALVSYVLGPDMAGILPGNISKIIGFSVTAIWWFVVSVPLIRNYRQKNYVEGEIRAGSAFLKIFSTIRKIVKKDRKVMFFLIAFFLYIDGVGTIIDNCINVGTDLGLNTVGQVIFLLLTQVVAFCGSLVFAKLSRKHETIPLLKICIAGYIVVCIYALFIHTIWDFGIMAFIVGCFQGSIQSLSRSYYSRIIPAENAGEYFGLYDIFAKGASFLGSAVIAAVKFAGGTINLALALLAVFFVLGFLFLGVADKTPERVSL